MERYLLPYLSRFMGETCKCKQLFWTLCNSFFHKLYHQALHPHHHHPGPYQHESLISGLSSAGLAGHEFWTSAAAAAAAAASSTSTITQTSGNGGTSSSSTAAPSSGRTRYLIQESVDDLRFRVPKYFLKY